MPVGNQQWPVINQVPITGRVYAPPLGQGGMPAPGQPLTGPAADVWRNFTLLTTAEVWPNGMATVDFVTPVSVLEIFALGLDQLFISWPAPTDGTPGTYRLRHPGDGQLVEVVPYVPKIFISTGTGNPPTDIVEVIGKGGVFGIPALAALAGAAGQPIIPQS